MRMEGAESVEPHPLGARQQTRWSVCLRSQSHTDTVRLEVHLRSKQSDPGRQDPGRSSAGGEARRRRGHQVHCLFTVCCMMRCGIRRSQRQQCLLLKLEVLRQRGSRDGHSRRRSMKLDKMPHQWKSSQKRRSQQQQQKRFVAVVNKRRITLVNSVLLNVVWYCMVW